MSKPETKKRPVWNFLNKIFGNPVIRGTIKSVPFGNMVYEIAENIKISRAAEKKSEGLPHSKISLFIQSACIALIVYLFVTHQVTADDVVRYIKAILDL